jgi:hypothetical protein
MTGVGARPGLPVQYRAQARPPAAQGGAPRVRPGTAPRPRTFPIPSCSRAPVPDALFVPVPDALRLPCAFLALVGSADGRRTQSMGRAGPQCRQPQVLLTVKPASRT